MGFATPLMMAAVAAVPAMTTRIPRARPKLRRKRNRSAAVVCLLVLIFTFVVVLLSHVARGIYTCKTKKRPIRKPDK
jgi:predicted PurR-regulated permease PerM